MSDVDNNEKEFETLIEDYKEKYGSYPLNGAQLLSHATQLGKQMGYSFVNSSLQKWVKEHPDKYNRNTPGISMTQPADKSTDDSKTEKKEDICWDDVWADYVKTYSRPPRESLHLWNHSKEMRHNVKYSEARNVFTALRAKYDPQKTNPKENSLRRHTVATPIQKQDQVTKEQLDEYVNEFVKKHTYHPKDARMLFNFCVEELQLQVKYGAISKAFSSFYTPPTDVQRRYSVPQVLTRSGKFVDYDKFMSKKAPHTSDIDPDDVKNTDPPTTTQSTDTADSSSRPSTTDTSVDDTKEVPVRENIGDVKDINAENQNKEKIVDLTPTLFNEMWAKYQNIYQNPPQNSRQLLTFANENGYNVTYGAIRRAWPSKQ